MWQKEGWKWTKMWVYLWGEHDETGKREGVCANKSYTEYLPKLFTESLILKTSKVIKLTKVTCETPCTCNVH